MPDAPIPIKLAAQRTGLSPHVIRIWEKRYQAVQPDRTGTQRRLYSEDEIERLRLLRLATESGHRIGDIARLPTEQLRALIPDPPHEPRPATGPTRWAASDAVAAALASVSRLDAPEFEAVLERASVSFGTHGVLQHVIAPLAHQVGEAWSEGRMTAAHEHFTSDLARTFLHQRARAYAESGSMPVLVAATPPGQLHDLGAAIAAAAARDVGWRVVFLGAGLPAAEIAGAAQQSGAVAVAFSIVYPPDDPNLPDELRHLRKLLGPDLPLLVGGRAAPAYAAALADVGAEVLQDLNGLYRALGRIRPHPSPVRDVS
jgi:MerR family transcriptional regulator, light-induced transcriptional regulator